MIFLLSLLCVIIFIKYCNTLKKNCFLTLINLYFTYTLIGLASFGVIFLKKSLGFFVKNYIKP